jgi:hypothetical protein
VLLVEAETSSRRGAVFVFVKEKPNREFLDLEVTNDSVHAITSKNQFGLSGGADMPNLAVRNVISIMDSD